jgi:hypothetical protein
MPRPASVSRCTRSGKLVALGWVGDSENSGVCNETHRRKRASGNDTRSAKKLSERDCFRLVRYPGEGVLSVGEISTWQEGSSSWLAVSPPASVIGRARETQLAT